MRNSPPKTKANPDNPWRTWCPAIVIVAAVIAAFWPAFSAGFIWDDNVMLTDSPLMRGPLWKIWTSASGVDYFPATYSSFWLEWRIWGMEPKGYHITNVVLHALSCVVLWRVFVRLKFPAAWLAALLFAVHPVNVESVAWVAERKNVLAMFFYALTALFFVRFIQSGQRRDYVISLVAFLLSLLSKPAAVAWPLIAFGIAWWIESRPRSTVPTRKLVALTAPFFIVALALGLITVWFQYHLAIKGDVIYERDFVTRVATAGMAVWFYLLKAVIPYPLCFVYPMWKMNPLSLPHFVPLIALLAVAGVSWRFRKTWGTIVLFALIYFDLLLAPVLGILKISFQRYSYVADHWQYFALPGVMVLFAAVLNKFSFHRIAGIAVACVFAVLTFSQARAYRSSEKIWENTLRTNPNSWVALGGLGLERCKAGRLPEGIDLCRRSLEIYPNQGESHANLGLALLQFGQQEEGIQHLREAIRIEPNYVPTYCNLASALKRQGKIDEAISLYRKAIELGPEIPLAYNALGSLYAQQHKTDEAAELFRKALAIFPDYPDALSNLGATFNLQRKPQDALPYLEKAVSLDPNNASVHANLGNALFDLKRIADARQQFEIALRIDPNLVPAKYGYDDCLKLAGEK